MYIHTYISLSLSLSLTRNRWVVGRNDAQHQGRSVPKKRARHATRPPRAWKVIFRTPSLVKPRRGEGGSHCFIHQQQVATKR